MGVTEQGGQDQARARVMNHSIAFLHHSIARNFTMLIYRASFHKALEPWPCAAWNHAPRPASRAQCLASNGWVVEVGGRGREAREGEEGGEGVEVDGDGSA